MRYARNLTIVVPWVLLLVYIAMALPSVQGWDDTRGEASAVQKPQLSSAVADTAWSPDTHSESGVSATAVITEWHVYLPLTLRAYSFPPVTEWQPAFSPDGEQIVFVRQREGERSDVFLMNIDGSNVRNLTQTPEANEDTPTFSPDGAKIAFSSDREGHWNIYRMNLDGTGVEPVVSWAESDEMHPAFSPDGQYLAFSSNHEMGNWDLYSTTLTSGAWARLTTDPSVERFPVFSYSGSGLAYRREVDGDSEIYMLELVSRVSRRLTTSPGGDSYPTLSPDGSGVVFVSNRSGDFQIYGMNIAGGGVFKLIEPTHRAYPMMAALWHTLLPLSGRHIGFSLPPTKARWTRLRVGGALILWGFVIGRQECLPWDGALLGRTREMMRTHEKSRLGWIAASPTHTASPMSMMGCWDTRRCWPISSIRSRAT
jgi:TolB protein